MITVVQNFICTIPERLDLIRRNTPTIAKVWGDYEFIINYNWEDNFEEVYSIYKENIPKLSFYQNLEPDWALVTRALLNEVKTPYVLFINDKVAYNEEIQTLLTELFDPDETLYHIVQIRAEFPTKHHLVDEAFVHAKNGWIYVTSAGEKVPSDLLEKIHQRINIDMKILSVVKPYDDINGMIFQASLFKLFNGNRRKVHADKDHTIDDRSFLDKIQNAEGSEGSILEWEEFYGN